jgi:hypothetical protein
MNNTMIPAADRTTHLIVVATSLVASGVVIVIAAMAHAVSTDGARLAGAAPSFAVSPEPATLPVRFKVHAGGPHGLMILNAAFGAPADSESEDWAPFRIGPLNLAGAILKSSSNDR